MEDNFKAGHRQRMRSSYLASGADSMNDAKLLELLLSIGIPRMDVRDLSYRLISTFGSLDGVLTATPDLLMTVDGVGESTAVLISLVRDINIRANEHKNKQRTSVRATNAAVQYCSNVLSLVRDEKLLIVAVDNQCRVIRHMMFDYGGSNFVDADLKGIAQFLITINASAVIVAHNHPNGDSAPSAADCNFTINFRHMIETLGIYLLDHVVVGVDGAVSLRADKYFNQFFNKEIESIFKEK